jgi:type VI secretion system protein ImpH
MVLQVRGKAADMTGVDGLKSDDLADWIEGNFYQFDMVQLIEVIREILGGVRRGAHSDTHHDVSDDNPRNPQIFFEADPSLAFPPNDVSFVKIGEHQAAVRLSVLNILGASSPLPVWFSDYVCRNSNGADAGAGTFQNFLSIMQNRIHKLWVDAHLKYHIWSNAGNPAKRIFEKMSARPLERFEDYGLSCLGAFYRRAKSADGLKLLIKSIWKDIPIRIEENIGRWTSVENLRPLGRGLRFGKNAIAGSKVYDRTSKFRVSLEAVDIDMYRTFLPGGYNYKLLKKMICLYIDEPLICELEITCKQRDLEPARIGGYGLGRTMMLGKTVDDAGIHRYRVVF